MLYERSSLRYAHTPGQTGLVFTEQGELVLTYGGDGDLRIWKSINDDDPGSHCLGEFVYGLTYQNGRLLACTDRNTVQAYKYPAMDNDGQLLRFTAPATCVRMYKNMIVAGSEDTSIKMIKDNDLQHVIELQGHKGPVLALDISCNGLLASVAGDGQLKIWNLETAQELKNLLGFNKVNSFEQAKCFVTPVFEPVQGEYLAYAKGKELVVLSSSSDWEVAFTLCDEKLKGNFSCCSFSHDGRYLAAGSTAGEVCVFDFARKQQLQCEATSAECMAQSITGIVWHPDHNKELGYSDCDGQWGLLFTNKEPSAAVKKAAAAAEDVDFGNIEFEDEEEDDGDNLIDDVAAVDDDEDDDDDETDVDAGNVISLEKLKRKVLQSTQSAMPTDELSRDSDVKSVISSVRDSVQHAAQPVVFKQQAPFQPGATPKHLEHHYLAWNEVGIVTAHAVGADGAIDVEFHDVAVHHAMHMSNFHGHNMASLSSTVLALATEGATKLMCVPLDGAKATQDNITELPDCEGVQALAASSKLVAVATSMQFLRLFTAHGTQRQVLSLPGPVVALAAYEQHVLVVYHAAPSSENQQNMAAMLVHCNGLNLRCQQLNLPLPAQRKLCWLGFSDCGSPVFYDSMGLLQLYSLKSNCWLPICDTMKHSQSVSNNYYIVAVQERTQIVQAVVCRGASYPMTHPRPMLQELNMQQPLCDLETEKSTLEDALVRASIMSLEQPERLLKETALKLFALACRSDNEMRAREIIDVVACPELLQLAVKYASKLGRMHLADRISELMPVLQERKEQRETQQLFEMSLQGTLNAQPTAWLPQTPPIHNNHESNTKLAPKSMEISSAKRAALKRFSAGSAFAKKSTTVDCSTPSPRNVMESQENHSDSLLSQDSELPISNVDEKLATANRSPLNAVNPFASKRKLGEVDFFGTNKLKLAKK